MKESPKGWPRISSALFYEDPAKAIDWLCRAFGFTVRLRIEGEGGRIEHSELVYEDGLIMVGSEGGHSREEHRKSPRSVGGASTQGLCVAVEDADGHCATARAAGARILSEPKTTDYGEDYWADRTYEAEDLEGHRWVFMQRVRDPATEAT